MSEFIDMTGKTIGNITVIARIINDSKHAGARWLCKCNACNRLFATRTDKLNSSKYEECNHGDQLDIPNVGRAKGSGISDFYLVDTPDYGEIMMNLKTILEKCKYEG